MDKINIKSLLRGETGGMSEKDLIDASRGTYFEKFVDELIASRKKFEEDKIRKAIFMQQLQQYMQKPAGIPGATPIPNAPPQPNQNIRNLIPGGIDQTAPAGGIFKSPYRN